MNRPVSAAEVSGETDAPTWFTRALATPADVGRARVDGAEIAYRAWGEAADHGVLLVHGGGAHSRWWDHIGPELAARRRVIAFDLSGHGDSGRRESYGMQAWKHEILAVADAAGLTAPPVVIGHSLGGLVSLHAASAAGPQIAGVITVDSPVRDIAPEQRVARRGIALGPLRVYASAEAAIRRFRPIPEQPTLPYVRDHIARTSVREVEGGWSWKFDPHVFARQHTSPPLGPLGCRLAQFRAEYGIHIDIATEVLIDGSGNPAEIIEVPAAGHAIMLDQPLALITGVRAVLAQWDRRP